MSEEGFDVVVPAKREWFYEPMVSYPQRLGAAFVEVALNYLGRVHRKLPRYRYDESLEAARAMVQAVLSTIPELFAENEYEELMDKIEKADRRELLRLWRSIVERVHRRVPLFPKRSMLRPTV